MVNDKKRAGSGFEFFDKRDDVMSPAPRNHLAPTDGEPPTSKPAPPLVHPPVRFAETNKLLPDSRRRPASGAQLLLARCPDIRLGARHRRLHRDLSNFRFRSVANLLTVFPPNSEAYAGLFQPSTPIAVVGDLSRITVRAQLDEKDISRVKVGDRAEIKADAYPDRVFYGVTRSMAPRLGPKTSFSDRPTERSDAKILETIVDLDEGAKLPVGLRVDVFFMPDGELERDGRR